MKLIIELDENRFKDIQRIASIQIRRRNLTCEQIIANGIPLEDIKTEIKEKAKDHIKYADCGRRENGLYEALEIIDNHIQTERK